MTARGRSRALAYVIAILGVACLARVVAVTPRPLVRFAMVALAATLGGAIGQFLARVRAEERLGSGEREVEERFGESLPEHAVGAAQAARRAKDESLAVRPPRRPAAPADAIERKPPALGGRRVLVVDDDDDTRYALTAVLTRAGAELRAVESAAAAMEALRDWRPDVLVSDIGLPDADGYSLVRRVRARPAAEGGDVPAIALTGYAYGQDRVRGVDAGFQRYLVKPVDPDELVDVIATLATAGPLSTLVAAPPERRVETAERALPDAGGAPPVAAAGLASVGVDEVLALVSHELSQPIAAMQIWLTLLETDAGDALSAEARDHLAQIRASVGWMAELLAGRLAADVKSRLEGS